MVQTAPIPMPALRRLPRYLAYLKELHRQGKEQVSAAAMADVLDIQHTLVRKDLALTGVEGQPKVGHKVRELITAIEKFLNWNKKSEAFLVGVGHLGMALLNYGGLKKAGFNVVAGFDVDKEKTGQWIAGIKVLPVDKLSNLAKRMGIEIGIIATPAEVAQSVADQLVAAGVRAIWNFAPVTLKVPADVVVEDVDIYASLAVLLKRYTDLVKL